MRNTWVMAALCLLWTAGTAFGQGTDASLSTGASSKAQGFGYGNLFGGGRTAIGG